jgi:Domain of unknown function (DUF4124)
MPSLSLRQTSIAATAVLVLATCLSTPAFAQWKWRDKSGHVTVSDLPPPRDIAEKDVLQRPSEAVGKPAAAARAASAPASASAADKMRVDPELEARRKRAEQDQAAQRRQDDERQAAERAENCRRAQAQLRSLESGMRLARLNDKGEREILDDKQRAEESRVARDAVAANCR